jgi:hypothetical protein
LTDRPHENPPHDERTRDITLPPLTDRPPSALPRAWAAPPVPASSAAASDFSAPPPETHVGDATHVADIAAPPPGSPRPNPLTDQPTDELRPRPRSPRQPTLAFSEAEMKHRPAGQVRVDRMPRRWPWVVLFGVPVLVIAAAGITLLVLLRGG